MAQLNPPPTPLTHSSTNPILSSSPAFATPAQPLPQKPALAPIQNAFTRPQAKPASILPILLPPQTLRPIAFRTFTKKHNLTLTASALSTLATFIGRHCGSGWREEGLAEGVLEEVARQWKKGEGGVIIDAERDGGKLKDILKGVEAGMAGGRVNAGGSSLSRENSGVGGGVLERMVSEARRPLLASSSRTESQDSLGMSTLDVSNCSADEEDEQETPKHLRAWIHITPAFKQPRLAFNATRKHFERSKTPSSSSLLSSPADKIAAFRQRYHVLHQRVLRNESFQPQSITATNPATSQWRLTPIANLLGRSGTAHVLLGMLAITPVGTLALNDLTGSIQIDLEQAAPIDAEVETWLCPGMIVLVEGVYEEELDAGGGSLVGQGGVGGTLAGRFVGFAIGAPKAETRAQSLGLSDNGQTDDAGHAVVGGGFGWVDFLGVGSMRAAGTRMRRLEERLLTAPLSAQHTAIASLPPGVESAAGKLVLLGCVHLDDLSTLSALRKLFTAYTAAAQRLLSQPVTDTTISPASTLPACFVFYGPFTSTPALTPAATDSSSRHYKEAFDALAALLHDFPLLTRHTTFVFVPAPGDPWASAFGAGASVPLPRHAVPDMFTTRVRREFASANADTAARAKESTVPSGKQVQETVHGEAIFTSNPSRLSLFGPLCEIVLFRDDATGRLRRNAVTFGSRRQNHQHDVPERVDADSGVEMLSSPPLPHVASPPTGHRQHEGEGEAMDMDDAPPPQPRPLPTQPPPPLDATTTHARRLTKSLLDQSHLAPYPTSIQPLHWAHAHTLSLYPLPSALALCDAEAAPFAVVYQGCAVVNAGRLVGPVGTRGRMGVRWVEFALSRRRGVVRSMLL